MKILRRSLGIALAIALVVYLAIHYISSGAVYAEETPTSKMPFYTAKIRAIPELTAYLSFGESEYYLRCEIWSNNSFLIYAATFGASSFTIDPHKLSIQVTPTASPEHFRFTFLYDKEPFGYFEQYDFYQMPHLLQKL